jgi:hypothetical protein
MIPDPQRNAQKLYEMAMLDPQVALHLRNFPKTDAQVYTWTKRLNTLLNLAQGESRSNEASDE